MLIPTPHHILFVGCGGTGSNLVPWLSNLVKSNNIFFRYLESTLFIDPDTVSESNLKRQHFFQWQIHQPKAKIFAQAYQSILKSESIFASINPESLEKLFSHYQLEDKNIWVICCTDNAQSRKDTLEFLQSKVLSEELTNYFWLSPGNDDTSGVVATHLVIESTAINTDPMALFPNWANGGATLRDDNTYSCGGNFEAGSQHFLVNGFASLYCATILSNYVENHTLIPVIHFETGLEPVTNFATAIDLDSLNSPSASFTEDSITEDLPLEEV